MNSTIWRLIRFARWPRSIRIGRARVGSDHRYLSGPKDFAKSATGEPRPRRKSIRTIAFCRKCGPSCLADMGQAEAAVAELKKSLDGNGYDRNMDGNCRCV